MADRCAGCTNKFKFREKPTVCTKCHRNFCSVCIPPAKHKKHKKDHPATPVRDTCVYCTRQLQEALKAQDAEVLENFPERFYHSPHLVPQVQSRVQLDGDRLRAAAAHTGRGLPQPTMTEEDRKLEERLRKLKESHKTTAPTHSEEDLHDRLAKLRDESEGGSKGEEKKTSPPPPPTTAASETKPSEGGTDSSGGPPHTDRMQTEEANELLGQMSDRVKLDSRMEQTNQHRDEELRSRFQALTGKKVESGDSASSSHSQHLEESIHKFLSGLEVQLEDEDPEKLLEDFKRFQVKEERAALTDATSSVVQAVVEKAKELHQQEEEEMGEEGNIALVTPYPELPPSMEGEDVTEGRISETDISKVLEAAKKEMEEEARERKEIDEFVSETSQRLGKLRGEACQDKEDEDEDVVRSKLEPRGGSEKLGLDFSWGHFGQDGRANLETSGGTGESAARQLGITLSGDLLESDEVQDLVKRMTAEAALDTKLEKRGLDRYLESSSRSDGASVSHRGGDKEGATASASGGATAATNSASGWAWGDSEDLPWCCICNADAQIRCYDCDDDLYCMQCFSEGHEQFGLFDHKYAPFEPPSSKAV